MAGSPAGGGDQASHDSEHRSDQLPSAAVKSAAKALAQGRQPSGVIRLPTSPATVHLNSAVLLGSIVVLSVFAACCSQHCILVDEQHCLIWLRAAKGPEGFTCRCAVCSACSSVYLLCDCHGLLTCHVSSSHMWRLHPGVCEPLLCRHLGLTLSLQALNP